jgi:malonyl-CoA/methylmalonyl-CoA synthetase
MNQNLYSALQREFPATHHPCLASPDGTAISYGQMHARSAQLAQLLRSRGVQPGDRVAVQAEKSSEVILLYLAVLRVGAVYLPLNTAYTLAELEYFLADSTPRVLVCDPARASALEPLSRRLGVAVLETLGADAHSGTLGVAADKQSVIFEDVARDGTDLAAILYTSGTTGRSKGAMLTHGNLLSNARALRDAWHFESRDQLLHALPIFHIHGLFVAINVTLAAGATALLLPKFDPDQIFEHLASSTVMMGVPTFYVRLLQDARLSPDSTASIRLFVSGSAPLLAETHRAWQARTGRAILERYGMTETGINTSNPYDGERRAGTVGLPLPGVDLRVVDLESRSQLGRDALGMIEVRGPNVFAGYWRNPEKTQSEFHEGYFVTGDIGLIDTRGYVHILGRGKDLIISGGYNVYPKEIEDEIDALEGVAESAVVGLPHPDLGEGVTAIVVPEQHTPALSEALMLERLRARLARYKCPKRILFVGDLPRNTMGKVQKNVLRDTYQTLYRPSEGRSRDTP